MLISYIHELLFDHNCVILPGFGGFIANRIPSKVNDIQQRVEPPRRIVAFNRNLTQNDGLLAHLMAKKEGISYDMACDTIRDFVNALQSELTMKKHTQLRGIGDLYLNSENNIVFIPEADINFSKETFGLLPISIRKLENVLKEKEKSTPDAVRLKPEPQVAKAPGTARRWVYGAMLIVIPVVAGLFTQQSGILQKADFNINQFFHTAQPNKVIEVVKTEDKPTPQTTDVTKENSVPVVSPEPVPTPKPETAPVAADKPQVTKAPETQTVTYGSGHYHIIGGSFAVASNANSLLNSLRSKGYNAYLAGTNGKGLTMVSYGNYATEAEANAALQDIRSKDNKQAWVLNK